VRDLTDLIVVRFDKPYLLWDFLYWLFGYAKLFQQATDIVHSHAENVRCQFVLAHEGIL